MTQLLLALAVIALVVLAGLPPAPMRTARADPPARAAHSAPSADTKGAAVTSKLGAPPLRPAIPLDFNNDGVLDTIRREMR